MNLRLKIALIFLLTVAAAVIAYPREGDIFSTFGLKNSQLSVKQGLDLQGGAQLTFQADLSKISQTDRDEALNSLIQVMQRRANFGGTSEVVVQQQGSDRVLVQLPGVKDVNEAIDRIGKTANLTFVEVNAEGQQIPTGIDGSDVQQATPDFDIQTNRPVVRLQLKSGESTKQFADLTTRLNQANGFLLTLLDEQVVFGPATVSQPITDGNAQLSGNFRDVAEARRISEAINAGALPVPVTLVEQRSVGPSLGKESVQRSLVAGAIGLGIVALFMILYYRLAGVLAVLALITYTLITLALYKLSVFIPGYTIVLTLAGIAGFILSIGMAVDANILIFERLKEELRSGKTFVAATETAFDRAWTSIRDSNVSTLITTLILYISSSATPIIRGFAVTLGLGVLVSMFTAIVVTRTLLRLFIKTKLGRNPRMYGLKPEEITS